MSITTATVTTAGNIVYTSGGNTAVTWLSLNNWGPANVTANLHVVPNGDSVTSTNQVYYALFLSSGDTYQIYQAAEKIVLGDGDTIYVNATANTVSAVTSYTAI